MLQSFVTVVITLSTSFLLAPPENAKKPAAPAVAAEPAKSEAASSGGAKLALTGLTMTVPAGWKAQEIPPGPMAPKAIYTIPELKPSEGEGVVRITYFPEMKGKDDMNIDRWVGQVTNAEGKPATRAEAKIEKVEMGNIRLTLVDVSGNVKMTMRDTGKPDHRMIAAIVDHPKGPHFVVAAGPTGAMKTWAAEITAFLKSAQVSDK